MGISRQEYWSGLLFPPPGDLPHPRIKPTFLVSLALTGVFLTTEPPRKPPASFYLLFIDLKDIQRLAFHYKLLFAYRLRKDVALMSNEKNT